MHSIHRLIIHCFVPFREAYFFFFLHKPGILYRLTDAALPPETNETPFLALGVFNKLDQGERDAYSLLTAS